MAKTESTMMPLGQQAPDFRLPEPGSARHWSRDELAGPQGLLLMFICNHCPFVVHIEQGLRDLGRDYADSGIGIAAICSNDAASYPDDAPEKMAQKRYPFPYLYDESQAVARAYDAACTPDLFLFDARLRCVYRGQFDDARPGNGIAVSGASLRQAMDALLAGADPVADQHPSIGCNIKWRRP